MARSCFEVEIIEFKEEESSFIEYFRNWFSHKFYKIAQRYIPKIISRVKSQSCYRNKLIIEFKKTISLNTLNNILYSTNFSTFIILDIKYNVEKKKVVVKVR